MRTKKCPECNTVMVKVGYSTKWWSCPTCGATAPARKPPKTPTQRPDTSVRLGEERRAWLVAKYGGMQTGIKRLISEAMEEEARNGDASLPQAVG